MIGELKYHLVWCTKYRRKVLTPEIQERLKALIYEKCKEHSFEVLELETMPDHVHLFVSADSRASVHRIVSQLKGWTASILRIEFNELKTRLPNLWTRSYYAGTVGFVSDQTVRNYILNQKRNSSQP